MSQNIIPVSKNPLGTGFGISQLSVQLIFTIIITVGLSYAVSQLKVWPVEWTIPIKNWISSFFTWLDKEAAIGSLKLKSITRSIAWLIEKPLDWSEYLLFRGIKSKDIAAMFWIFVPLIGLLILKKRLSLLKCTLTILAVWALVLIDFLWLNTGLYQLPETFMKSIGIKKLDPLPWIVVVAGVGLLGHWIGGWPLAIFSSVCIGYLAVMGLWKDAMKTFSIVLVSVPFAIVVGLWLGVASTQSKRVSAITSPMFDLMQATPHMAYLLPVVVLFGAGQVPAMIATVIFAMPPMARCVILGIQSVPSDIKEAGSMSGCTPRQLLWKVTLPSSQRILMLGVNQVVMQTLAMVVIASMVGAQGLGHKLLFSLQQLRLGAAVEQGLAIVLMAIVLDRLTQAYANRAPGEIATRAVGWRAHKHWLIFLALMVVAYGLAYFVSFIEKYPKSYTFTLGRTLDFGLREFSKFAYDYVSPVRDFITVYMLIPMRDFFLWTPWISLVSVVGLVAYRLGGWQTMGLTVGLILFVILLPGNWNEGILTLYLVTSAVILCVIIGVPIGIWASRSKRAAKVIMTICDTLQTFPSFIYLIPVIMLLKVGDLSNVVAIIAYAAVPAIRYTYLGIKRIPEAIIEAAIANGTTPRQRLWKVELPIALPEIMLGINQTIMMALAMTAITALIGSSDLGQEIYRALPTADSGRGIMAGLGIATIGIVADRLIQAWARKRKKQLGMEGT